MKIIFAKTAAVFLAAIMVILAVAEVAPAQNSQRKLIKTMNKYVVENVNLYTSIQSALAAGTTENVSVRAELLYDNLMRTAEISNIAGHKDIFASSVRMADKAKAMKDERMSLREARARFKPLSEMATMMANEYMSEMGRENLSIFYDKDNEVYWIQRGTKSRNPFTGEYDSNSSEYVHFDDFEDHLKKRIEAD